MGIFSRGEKLRRGGEDRHAFKPFVENPRLAIISRKLGIELETAHAALDAREMIERFDMLSAKMSSFEGMSITEYDEYEGRYDLLRLWAGEEVSASDSVYLSLRFTKAGPAVESVAAAWFVVDLDSRGYELKLSDFGRELSEIKISSRELSSAGQEEFPHLSRKLDYVAQALDLYQGFLGRDEGGSPPNKRRGRQVETGAIDNSVAALLGGLAIKP